MVSTIQYVSYFWFHMGTAISRPFFGAVFLMVWRNIVRRQSLPYKSSYLRVVLDLNLTSNNIFKRTLTRSPLLNQLYP
jgi:hypothetical protein